MTAPRLLFALALVLAASACPSDDDDGRGLCDNEDRAIPYEAGMQFTTDDGLLVLTLDDADPAPPDLGDNDWYWTVADDAGAAKAGCTLQAIPFMEDHGHGSNEPSSEPSDAEGAAMIPAIDFIMPGFWETAIEVVCDDGTEDRTSAPFCIEG